MLYEAVPELLALREPKPENGLGSSVAFGAVRPCCEEPGTCAFLGNDAAVARRANPNRVVTAGPPSTGAILVQRKTANHQGARMLVYNSQTHKKEELVPIEDGKIRM